MLFRSADVSLVGRVATNLLTIVTQIPRIDVAILADVDSSGAVNALDTAAVLQRSRAASTPTIPAIPALPPAPAPASAPTSKPSSASSLASASSNVTSAGAAPLIDLAGSFSNFSLGSAPKPVLQTASLRILPSALSAGVAA